MGKDYYQILGVAKNASEEDIKKAYRRLAHEHHPDKGGDANKFKEINEAYQVLSNREKRRQYDQFGRAFDAGAGMPPNWDFNFGQGFPPGFEFNFGGDFGFGDDLSSVFEGIFEGLGVRKKRRTVHTGSDIRLVLVLTLEEAAFGGQKELAYETWVKCAFCEGRGYEKNSDFKTCETCDGRGEIKETRQSFFGAFTRVKTCPNCFGEGKIPEKICKTCHGRGRVKGKKKITVNIQPGIMDSQIIRVAGAGEDGERGTSGGDLYVEARVKPHPLFKREGADLIYETKISVTQAILGAEIEIPTLSAKKILVKVPAGTESGKILRIKNKGLPYFGRFGSGDLLIKIEILIPKKVSSKAKKLLDELEKELE